MSDKGHVHKVHLHATEAMPQTLIPPHPMKDFTIAVTQCYLLPSNGIKPHTLRKGYV